MGQYRMLLAGSLIFQSRILAIRSLSSVVFEEDLAKSITLTLLTDSQTTIDSLRSVRPIVDRMNQHLLDNVKKCVDQVRIIEYID